MAAPPTFYIKVGHVVFFGSNPSLNPAPISTAIKLSEPQINLAEREILLEYSDQYCSPGLEGAQGTLKAFGSASSLGGGGAGVGGRKSTTPGLSILKSW